MSRIWYFSYANPAWYCCNMKFMTCEIYGYFKSCACEHDAHERFHPTVPAGIPRGSKHVDNVPYYRLYLMSCVTYYKMSRVTVHYTHLIQGEISVNHFITHVLIVQCCVGIKDLSMKARLDFRLKNMHYSRWYILTNTASGTKTLTQ